MYDKISVLHRSHLVPTVNLPFDQPMTIKMTDQTPTLQQKRLPNMAQMKKGKCTDVKNRQISCSNLERTMKWANLQAVHVYKNTLIHKYMHVSYGI